MANILYPPSRPQSVGEILDSTFRIFGATLVKCLPLAIAGVILGQLANLYNVAKNGKPGLDPAARLALLGDRVFWLCYIVGLLLAVLFANAVMLRQYTLLCGGQFAGGGVLQRAAARMPGVVLIIIVMMLAMFATMIPLILVVAVPFGVAGALRGVASPQSAVWLGALSILVAAVAVSWIVIRWICSTIVYLLTDRGPLESMSYSWRLTSGSFWRLFVIYSVALVILIVFYFIFTLLGTALAGVLAHGDVAVMTGVMSMVVVVLGAIFAPFYSALMLSVYGDLTVRKEGADLASRLAASE